MRSLLIAPFGSELSVLRRVLEDEQLTSVSSVSLGAGIQLAKVPLATFDAAVIVLPKARDTRGLAAVLFEAGIAAGRGLPLFTIAPPGASLPPALSGVPNVKTALDNAAALRLHIDLFVQSLRSRSIVMEQSRTQPSGAILESNTANVLIERLSKLRNGPAEKRGIEFEQLVFDVLRTAGAHVEQESGPDREADAALSIPGEEQRLGVVLVEAKTSTSQTTLRSAERKLQAYVVDSGAGLGLMVYDLRGGKRGPEQRTTPLVLSVPFDDLLAELRLRSLADILTEARIEAVHRT